MCSSPCGQRPRTGRARGRTPPRNAPTQRAKRHFRLRRQAAAARPVRTSSVRTATDADAPRPHLPRSAVRVFCRIHQPRWHPASTSAGDPRREGRRLPVVMRSTLSPWPIIGTRKSRTAPAEVVPIKDEFHRLIDGSGCVEISAACLAKRSRAGLLSSPGRA